MPTEALVTNNALCGCIIVRWKSVMQNQTSCVATAYRACKMCSDIARFCVTGEIATGAKEFGGVCYDNGPSAIT
jgi:hypothetical protein